MENETKPLLFIWIPKTAGTSIYETLVHKGMVRFLDGYEKFTNEGSVTFGHADIHNLIKSKIISKEYWSGCYPFMVVRNPYERFVSLWNYFIANNRLSPACTLFDFAYSVYNSTCSPGAYNVHDLSQAAAQHKWHLPGVNTFRFENLTVLEQDLGINLQKLNVGKGNHMNYYDTRSIKIVTDIYYDDFTLFNYDIIT